MYKSKTGKNLGHSAEIMTRYIQSDPYYVEAHEAEPDSSMEMNLAEKMVDNSKKYREFCKDFLGNPKSVHYTKVKKRLSSTQKIAERNSL